MESEEKSKWLIYRDRRKTQHTARQAALARLLRSARAQLGLTQRQLAPYLGVSEFTVKRWERRDGVFPRNHRWYRIRAIWMLVRYSKTNKFLLDREEPADFSC